MSKTSGSGKSAEAPQLVLQKIYVKDLSFESPRAVEVFTEPLPANPEINLQLNTVTRKLSDNLYEVTLILAVAAKVPGNDTLLYQLELKQAGLFTLAHFNQQELDAMVSAFCPNVLFPYARETVSGMVERGGFPQLLLAPINFDALYQQHLAKLKTAGPEASDARH